VVGSPRVEGGEDKAMQQGSNRVGFDREQERLVSFGLKIALQGREVTLFLSSSSANC
jgi:hypothetical protein